MVEPSTLRANRNFRLLWVGQSLSQLGSSAGSLAYPLLLLALTRSPVLAGLVGTLQMTVETVGRLPGGALADRLDRRALMIGCDVVRAVVLGLLALLVALGAIVWPVVLVVAMVDAAGLVLFTPAEFASLPAVVPSEQLAEANAANEARSYGSQLAGPPLGGLLYGVSAALPFLADAVSFVASFVTVSRLRGRFRPNRQHRNALHREIAEGLAFTWHTPLLRAVALQAPLVNFAANGVFYTVILALRQGGTQPVGIGLVVAVISCGGLAGALVAPQLQRRLRLSTLVIVMTWGGALLLGVAAAVTPSLILAVPIAATFFLGPAANASLFASVMRATPDHLHGRVSSTLLMLATSLAALAPVLSGLLIVDATAQWAMAAFAIAMALAALIAALSPSLRQAETN